MMKFSHSLFSLLAIKLNLTNGQSLIPVFTCEPCGGFFAADNSIPILGPCGNVYTLNSFAGVLDQPTCDTVNSVVRFSGCCAGGDGSTEGDNATASLSDLGLPDIPGLDGLSGLTGLTGGDAVNLDFDFTGLGDSIMGFLGIDNSPVSECNPCSMGEFNSELTMLTGGTCGDMYAASNTTGFDAISCAAVQSLINVGGCCKVEGTEMGQCSMCGAQGEFDPTAITTSIDGNNATCSDVYASQEDLMAQVSGFACSSIQEVIVLSGCCGDVPIVPCDPCTGNSTFVPEKTMMLGGTCRDNFPAETFSSIVTAVQCQAVQAIVGVGGCCEENGEAIGGIGSLMNTIPGLAQIPGLEMLNQQVAPSTCSACEPGKSFYGENDLINGTTCGATVPLSTELPSFACVLQQTVIGGLGCCSPPFDVCTPCAVDEQFYENKGLVNGTTCADAFVAEGFVELQGIDCTATQAVVRFTGCCGPKAAPPGSCTLCSEENGEFMPDKIIANGRCGDIYSQENFDGFVSFLCTQNQGAVNRNGCCSASADAIIAPLGNDIVSMDGGDDASVEATIGETTDETVAEESTPPATPAVETAPAETTAAPVETPAQVENTNTQATAETTSGAITKSISMVFVTAAVMIELFH